MPLEIYFYFLCPIKLSPGIIYLLHIKMLYFASGVPHFRILHTTGILSSTSQIWEQLSDILTC